MNFKYLSFVIVKCAIAQGMIGNGMLYKVVHYFIKWLRFYTKIGIRLAWIRPKMRQKELKKKLL